MISPPPKPPRERVILAQRPGARRVRTRVEVAEQTEIGEALIGGLIRAQLGSASSCALVIVAIFAALPVLFEVAVVAETELLGIRLPWLVLGVAAYPLLWATGRFYVRRSERNEHDFLELTGD